MTPPKIWWSEEECHAYLPQAASASYYPAGDIPADAVELGDVTELRRELASRDTELERLREKLRVADLNAAVTRQYGQETWDLREAPPPSASPDSAPEAGGKELNGRIESYSEILRGFALGRTRHRRIIRNLQRAHWAEVKRADQLETALEALKKVRGPINAEFYADAGEEPVTYVERPAATVSLDGGKTWRPVTGVKVADGYVSWPKDAIPELAGERDTPLGVSEGFVRNLARPHPERGDLGESAEVVIAEYDRRGAEIERLKAELDNTALTDRNSCSSVGPENQRCQLSEGHPHVDGRGGVWSAERSREVPAEVREAAEWLAKVGRSRGDVGVLVRWVRELAEGGAE